MKKILFLLVTFSMIVISCRTQDDGTPKIKKESESSGLMPLNYKTHIKGRDKNTPEAVKSIHPLYVSSEIILKTTYTLRNSGKDENGHDYMVDSTVTETKKINTKEVGTIIDTKGANFEELFVSFAVENDPLIYLIWFQQDKLGNYFIKGGKSSSSTIAGRKYTISTSENCHLLYRDNYKKYNVEIEGEADGNPGK